MRVTVQRVLDAIDEVAGWLPELSIVTADCHGRAWLIDTITSTIYVNSHQTAGRWASSTLGALDVLCDHHQMPRPGQVLRLIPTARLPTAMTGTGD